MAAVIAPGLRSACVAGGDAVRQVGQGRRARARRDPRNRRPAAAKRQEARRRRLRVQLELEEARRDLRHRGEGARVPVVVGAEVGGLQDLEEPLVGLLDRVVERGRVLRGVALRRSRSGRRAAAGRRARRRRRRPAPPPTSPRPRRSAGPPGSRRPAGRTPGRRRSRPRRTGPPARSRRGRRGPAAPGRPAGCAGARLDLAGRGRRGRQAGWARRARDRCPGRRRPPRRRDVVGVGEERRHDDEARPDPGVEQRCVGVGGDGIAVGEEDDRVGALAVRGVGGAGLGGSQSRSASGSGSRSRARARRSRCASRRRRWEWRSARRRSTTRGRP